MGSEAGRFSLMPFVIAEPCVDVMDTACMNVCPVDCIHHDDGQDRKLYINPDDCIECGACEAVCPVTAIFSDLDLPAEWYLYAEIDALWYRDKNVARAQLVAVAAGK